MAAKKKAGLVNADSAYPGERDWRAEDDMRSLARAEEIKNDPARLKAAKACARRKLLEIEQLLKK